jgi:hypothetical protein
MYVPQGELILAYVPELWFCGPALALRIREKIRERPHERYVFSRVGDLPMDRCAFGARDRVPGQCPGQ